MGDRVGALLAEHSSQLPGKRLRVELSEVDFVGDQGKILLTEMLHSGAELVATGPMMKALLADIAAG